MKNFRKVLSMALLVSFIANFAYITSNANAIIIPEGAVVKTATHHDVFIIKYLNGKRYKRLVLNPQVFESYGHLRWEDILVISQSEMNIFPTSDLVRVYGRTDVYKLIPNGDIGSKHFLVANINDYDTSSVYTINNVDFDNYKTGDAVVIEEDEEIIKYTTKEVNVFDFLTGLDVIYIAPLNSEVFVINEREGWAHIKIVNKEGWIESKYLSYSRTQVQILDTVDNDNDGLMNWEEDQQGTDKNNPDTDYDGIIDGEDSHPSGGGRLRVQHFEWDYSDEGWEWDISIHSDWYDYYANKARKPHGTEYVTYDDYYIKEIANMLTKASDENSYSKSLFAAAFVQSIGYVSDEKIGYDDYPKYPLETILDQNGDCEDSSYLAASIIFAMNIDCVLVELPGHMAIAIAMLGSPGGYYYSMSNGWDYYFMETTAIGWEVGDMDYDNSQKAATLVKIPSGEMEILYPNKNKSCSYSYLYPGYYYDDLYYYYTDSLCNNPI